MKQLRMNDVDWSLKRGVNAATAASALDELAGEIQAFIDAAEAERAAGNGSQWTAIEDFVNEVDPRVVELVSATFLDPDVIRWLFQQENHIRDAEHYLRDLSNTAGRMMLMQSRLGVPLISSSQEEIPTHPHTRDAESPVSGSAPPELLRLVHRFHVVATQLQDRHDRRPTLAIEDEYDVQDLLHALLRLHFDDVRPEEWTPSYAGKASRVDFFLKPQQILVEVKKTRPGLGAKELSDQLIIDIHRYAQMTTCKALLCFVYDPAGLLKNPRGFENDLSGNRDDLLVQVIVAPRQ